MRNYYQYFNNNERDWLFLGVPLLISLLIKLILILVLYSSPINNDGILYINAARQYAMGNFANGLALYPMPVYPLLLTFIHMVIPDWITAGYFIAVSSMVLAIIPLYYLTKIMFSKRAAFWACLAFAILPRMNGWSMNISRDPLFLVLFISCIYFAFRSIRRTDLFLFVTTFIFAWVATLIRIEGVLFLGYYFFVLIYIAIVDKEKRSLYFLRCLIWIAIPLLFGGGALLFNGTYGISVNRFGQVYSEVILLVNGDAFNRSFEIYQFFSEIAGQPPFTDNTYGFVSLCRHFLPLIYVLAIVQVLVKILFPLLLIPLYLGFKDQKKPSGNSGKFIFWIWLLFFFLGYYFLIKYDMLITRWGIVPATLLLPWAGLGLEKMWAKTKVSSHKRTVLLLILIILIAPTAKTFSLITSKDITTSKTVKWLVDNDKIDKVPIVSNSIKDVFYFDLEAQEHINTDWKTHYYDKDKALINIEQFAIEKNAEIIVLKVKSRHIDKINCFQFYQEVKAFVGNKYTTFIYRRLLADEN
jgi:4-amino-4-deoxy-L-arabinose transferase-like glycosyltransferase